MSARSTGRVAFPVVRVSTAGSIHGAFDRFLLDQLPTGHVMNLGSGAGQHVGNRRTVVNVDHVAPAMPVGPCVVADAMNLPFRDGAFDGALLKDVIEHLSDPIEALAETLRVVRDHGDLIVEVPRAIPRAVWADPTHLRGFTARAVTTALTLGGWQAGRPQRIGGFPGAGRLGLIPHLTRIMRVPGIGHWLGTNWLIRAKKGVAL